MPIPADTPYRSLLVDAIDFAGLFPPAGQGMPEAVHAYGGHRQGPDAWALGRFVVPASRLAELAASLEQIGPSRPPWLLAVTCAEPAADAGRVAGAADLVPGDRARVDTVEFPVRSVDELMDGLAAFPRDLNRYVEMPLGEDPEPYVAMLKFRGAGAKFRTGGVTREAFPPADELVRALDAVVRAGVPFKCTAGLHHPVRGTYRLTYLPGSDSAVMYGYLNAFLAVAALVQGEGREVAGRILLEDDPAAFGTVDGDLGWRALRFARAAIRAMRRRALRSFGSCSFREPLDELESVVRR